MIQKKVFNHLAKVPQIYQCLVCHQIPKKTLQQDSDCGRLTCIACKQMERVTICECKNITQIDYITHKTLQQIQINCHICLLNINYNQFNKHLKNCQIFQTQIVQTQNLQLINDKFCGKLICKICKLQYDTCQYCQNQCCINCYQYQNTCCKDQSESNISKLQDDSFQCNYCSEKIYNLTDHLKQCEIIIVNCEFCLQDFKRKNYLFHLELCLRNKLVSLEFESEIQNQVIDFQKIYIKQATRNHLFNQFYETIHDHIAREDETLPIN